MQLVPRTQVPALDVPLVAGGRWSMETRRPDKFTLLVFYRGFH